MVVFGSTLVVLAVTMHITHDFLYANNFTATPYGATRLINVFGAQLAALVSAGGYLVRGWGSSDLPAILLELRADSSWYMCG